MHIDEITHRESECIGITREKDFIAFLDTSRHLKFQINFFLELNVHVFLMNLSRIEE